MAVLSCVYGHVYCAFVWFLRVGIACCGGPLQLMPGILTLNSDSEAVCALVVANGGARPTMDGLKDQLEKAKALLLSVLPLEKRENATRGWEFGFLCKQAAGELFLFTIK